MSRSKIVCLVLLALGIAYAMIYGRTLKYQILQQLGTIVIVGALLNRQLTNRSVYLVTAFGLMHVVGGCYLYSYVPYNEWILSLTGGNFNIQEFFGFERNHYDRLVHFSFGLLFMSYARDLTKNLFMAWLCIQTFSMVYELFEWSLTLMLAGDAADSYNGQQGDAWDAHKDMALAMFGSTISAAWLFIEAKRKGQVTAT